MIKVFSKFTKERVKNFQIETAIYEDEKKNRFVGKRALYPEGKPHVDAMVSNYQKYDQYFVKCEKKNEEVIFPFVSGDNYYELLLQYLQKKDKDGVLSILDAYKELIGKLYPETVSFEQTDAFKTVFGSVPEPCKYEAACGVNIDLTLDNVILCEGKPVVIDYEWIFEFPVPVKFPVYRALFALWIKHGLILSELITEEELYDYFGISKEDRRNFAKMNKCFGQYVEGGDQSYYNSLKHYEKKSWDIAGMIPGGHYVQVFYNDGTGYSEEQSEIHFFAAGAKGVSVRLNPDVIRNCTEIRIDPVECAAMIKITRLEAETTDYIRKITSEEIAVNGIVFEKNIIFACDDPQIIIKVPENESWVGFEMEFDVVMDDSAGIRAMNLAYEQKYIQKSKEYDEKYQVMMEMHQNQVAELSRKETLLRDKLAYIESTKVYRAALKKKVDALGLWGEL